MPRVRLLGLLSILTIVGAGTAATSVRARSTPAPAREIIAVYLGTEGTDAQSGMVPAVRDMKTALTRQAAASGRRFISRGVSLEASVDAGLRHLALLGAFDEVSVGGNWTNSAVVRYLGGNFGAGTGATIPQVVLLEREVQLVGDTSLVVGPEKEIGRYKGTGEIAAWVRRGAPIAP